MTEAIESPSVPAPGRSGIVQRVGWGVLDQAISSLGNFALGIIAARTLTPAEFGAFGLAFVTFSFVVGASRGPSTDPLMVRFSGPDTPEWRRAVCSASGTALNAGVLAGLCCLTVGLLAGGLVGTSFVALAVFLPGILLQDSYRFAFFSRGQGKRAFVNDMLWACLQVVALTVLLLADRITVATCLLAFGGSATVAAAFGWWQTRLAPRPTWTRAWLKEHRSLGGRYLIENVCVGGARQIQLIALGALAGLAAVAELRAAEILMGPFLIMLAGVSQVSVPEARQVLMTEPSRVRRFCFNLGAVQGALAATWAIAAMVILPWGIGELLLNGLWEPAQKLLIPLTAIFVLGYFHTAMTAGLRALGASRRSLTAQLTTSSCYALFGAIGAAVGGAWGSSWGVVLGLCIGLVTWWVQLGRGIRDHLVELAPPAVTPPEERHRLSQAAEGHHDVG
jgi:O-antigen/teichoic acid export membrane protein